jgi:hypothetical protein
VAARVFKRIAHDLFAAGARDEFQHCVTSSVWRCSMPA